MAGVRETCLICQAEFESRTKLFRHLEELHKAEEKCEGCAKAEGTGEDKQRTECLVQRYQQFASSFLLNQRSWEQQADEQGASTAEREQARKRDEEEATARLGVHVGLAPVRCGSCGETKARSCLTLDAHWLEQLVNSQAFQDASLYHPVSLAVVQRDEQALRWLLAAGLPADPHEPKPSEPSTPLALCVFQLSDCMLRNEELLAIARIVDVLLRHGANPLGPLALAIDRYGPACTSPDSNSSSASAVSSSPAAGWSCLPLIAKAAEQWQTKA